jgi:hypothetical protein
MSGTSSPLSSSASSQAPSPSPSRPPAATHAGTAGTCTGGTWGWGAGWAGAGSSHTPSPLASAHPTPGTGPDVSVCCRNSSGRTHGTAGPCTGRWHRHPARRPPCLPPPPLTRSHTTARPWPGRWSEPTQVPDPTGHPPPPGPGQPPGPGRVPARRWRQPTPGPAPGSPAAAPRSPTNRTRQPPPDRHPLPPTMTAGPRPPRPWPPASPPLPAQGPTPRPPTAETARAHHQAGPPAAPRSNPNPFRSPITATNAKTPRRAGDLRRRGEKPAGCDLWTITPNKAQQPPAKMAAQFQQSGSNFTQTPQVHTLRLQRRGPVETIPSPPRPNPHPNR